MAEGRSRALGWLAGALMLLGACSAGGPLPAGRTAPDPHAARIAPEDAPPHTTGRPGVMAASDGGEVVVSEWGAEEPSAVILALHGYGDYGDLTFRRAAPFWAEQGIATIAPDQRGFGRNGSRGRWPGADGLVADARGYVGQVRARFPCTPVILLGHSMGGGVAASAASGAPIDGLLLATPAIWGGGRLNPLHRAAAWIAAMVVPDQRFSGRGVVRIQASDNIEALRELSGDPLYLAPPSPREIFGLVRLVDQAAKSAGQITAPALMLLGSKDQIVPNATVRKVFARTAGPRKVIEYPEGWHLVFRDHQAKTVWQDVADWVGTVPAPSCAAS
ncbi:MAG: alpha/beta fold hydrolase [Pseudomonadota bacterium]